MHSLSPLFTLQPPPAIDSQPMISIDVCVCVFLFEVLSNKKFDVGTISSFFFFEWYRRHRRRYHSKHKNCYLWRRYHSKHKNCYSKPLGRFYLQTQDLWLIDIAHHNLIMVKFGFGLFSVFFSNWICSFILNV